MGMSFGADCDGNMEGELANEYADARVQDESGMMAKRLVEDARRPFEEVKGGLRRKSKVEEYSAWELVGVMNG